jgi:hypothetical protein
MRLYALPERMKRKGKGKGEGKGHSAATAQSVRRTGECVHDGRVLPDRAPSRHNTWEKHVLSARGFKRVGRHSEYAI